ncbi:hypothetical protein D9758_004057 [Tetrapyrgos nigripes]|uniref:Zinc finger PHD-type domain-containing protein n=1 Tax=Tetrapyrgos nigripes TaxID=182062 RepID=A0A8H5GLB9_9AGAR|nr:hypothetical protein D9758_004057 [Tetrapyrgos nigripes]
MPRRASARSALPAASDVHQFSDVPAAPETLPDDLILLRTQWKWAAFCQFCYTFSQILAMDDVTVNNIEDDLVHGLNLYLPRIIVRLLFTLTYDRKINLNNWQTALRRQYSKRDPAANPIGPEPPKENTSSRYTSVIGDSVTPEPPEHPDENTDDAPRSSTAPRDSEQVEGESKVKSEEDDSGLSSNVPAAAIGDGQVKQETKDWLTLPMLEKLDSLHLLTEWQFQNPTRFRQLMKSDDEQASWRIEPIGYDSKRNAYWLIGADRLWIQRVPPKPPRLAANKNLKRKRGAADTGSSKQARSNRTATTNSKRPRLQASSTKGKGKSSASTDNSVSGRRGRAAKAQANLKLDAQAKQLAELNRQAAAMSKSGSSARSGRRQRTASVSPSKPSPSRVGTRSRPLGTRLSARLRGTEEDEWQAIPEEWLNENENDDDFKASSRFPRKTGLESDKSSVSDLTELSDDDAGEDDEASGEEQDEAEADIKEESSEPESVEEVKYEIPENFVEWETLCATLHEWEHIAERWQKATHYAEKALYKVLTNHIVPIVTEELREIENKRRLEEAVVHRKRSSRLAVKELEKEEARAAARKKVEDDERLGRQRRAEARAKRDEAERTKREQAREQRRKEREAKEEAASDEAEEKAQDESEEIDVGELPPVQNTRRRAQGLRSSTNGWSTSRSGTSDWEVDCEICHRQGFNIVRHAFFHTCDSADQNLKDESVPMMCCGMCSKWQHIACHDRADELAGRMRRDWKKFDFYCLRCRERAAVNGSGGHHQQPVLLHPANSRPSPRQPSATSNGVTSSYMQMSYGQSSSSPHASGSPQLPNGYADYTAKAYQTMSDIRSSNASNSQLPYSVNPTMKQISFSHYQPQQHGFSSSYPTVKPPLRQHPSYGTSPQVQAYGQEPLTAHNQYGGYSNGSMNGQTQRYSQYPTSNNSTWNGNATQTMDYSSLPSYAASAERSSAGQPNSLQEMPQQQQHYRSQQWMPYNHNNTHGHGGNMGYTSYQHSS